MTRCYHYGVLLDIEVSELSIQWSGKGQRGELLSTTFNPSPALRALFNFMVIILPLSFLSHRTAIQII